MKNSILKDYRQRKDFYKQNCREIFINYIVKNQNIPKKIRDFYKSLSINNGVKIRNRCILTGRGRGVYRFCKLSRGLLQEKALAGELMGISKTSW